MLEENKAVVRRFVEEIQNKHNLDAVDELFSAGLTHYSHAPGMSPIPPGPASFRAYFEGLLAAFPDTRFTIHDQIAEGNMVATRKTWEATHLGEFLGIPATGRHINVQAMDIWSVVDGKLTDHWGQIDLMGLMQQLGAVPGPGPG